MEYLCWWLEHEGRDTATTRTATSPGAAAADFAEALEDRGAFAGDGYYPGLGIDCTICVVELGDGTERPETRWKITTHLEVSFTARKMGASPFRSSGAALAPNEDIQLPPRYEP